MTDEEVDEMEKELDRLLQQTFAQKRKIAKAKAALGGVSPAQARVQVVAQEIANALLEEGATLEDNGRSATVKGDGFVVYVSECSPFTTDVHVEYTHTPYVCESEKDIDNAALIYKRELKQKAHILSVVRKLVPTACTDGECYPDLYIGWGNA